jgi:hypothetical protein
VVPPALAGSFSISFSFVLRINDYIAALEAMWQLPFVMKFLIGEADVASLSC